MLITPRVSDVWRWLLSLLFGAPHSRLRILIHGMNYAPELIGVGKYTAELAEFLAARPYDVEVIAALPHYPGWFVRSPSAWAYTRAIENGILVTRCPLLLRKNGRGVWRLLAPLSFAIAAAPVVVWRIVRSRPDVVLCIEPTLLSAPIALLAARLIGARTVLHVQDLEIDAAFATGHLNSGALRKGSQALERRLLGRFDAVVTICQSMAARLRDKGVPEPRLSVLRNWVDLVKLKPSQPDGFLRALFNVPFEKRVVLYSGHLGVKQGLSVLLEATSFLARDTGIHVVIAGDGPMAHAIRSAEPALPNLTVLPLQPPDRLGDLLAMADVHVLPQDPAAADLVFPSKLGSLLASGKPVVVVANPGTELAIWLEGAATVVPAGDAVALAEALRAAPLRECQTERAKAKALAAELDVSVVLPAFERCLVQSLDPISSGNADPVPANPAAWTSAGDAGVIAQSA